MAKLKPGQPTNPESNRCMMARNVEGRIVKPDACGPDAPCRTCGFYPPEAERRKKIPLEVDSKTGLKRKNVSQPKEGKTDEAD